jgi:hypothetical protein
MSSEIILFLIAAAFLFLAAWQNWDWFFENHRARVFVLLFGRNGARVFYAALGCFLVVLSYALIPSTPTAPALVAVPKVNFIEVRATYPGASAGDVDTLVGKPIEQRINEFPELRSIKSESRDGSYRAQVFFEKKNQPERSLELVKNRVALAQKSLPAGITTRSEYAVPDSDRLYVLALIDHGEFGHEPLVNLARSVRDRFLKTGVLCDAEPIDESAISRVNGIPAFVIVGNLPSTPSDGILAKQISASDAAEQCQAIFNDFRKNLDIEQVELTILFHPSRGWRIPQNQ